MSKARDIARAGTALSSVDATELGYLDGVTSNVQTQIDSKAASATAVSTAGGSVISANSTGNALEIRQIGTGNALVVEDEANPDASPFIITGTGAVGIGTTTPSGKLDVSGTNSFLNGLRINGGNTADTIYQGTGNLGISAAAGAVNLNTNNTPRLTVDNAGATTVTYTTTTGGAVRNIYMSTSTPSGGSDGDVWIQYA